MITKAAPLAHQYIPNILKVTLIKSITKSNPTVRASVAALGLSTINRHRYHKNSSEIRGMIYQAARYVHIEEIPLNDPAASPSSTTEK